MVTKNEPWFVVPYLRFGDTVKRFRVSSGLADVDGVGAVDPYLVVFVWVRGALWRRWVIVVATIGVSSTCGHQVAVDKVHVLHHILEVYQGTSPHLAFLVPIVVTSLCFCSHFILANVVL